MSSSRPSPRPAPPKRRSWWWRYRRLLFLVGLLLATALAGVAFVIAHIPLPPENFQAQTTFLTDASGNQLAVLHGRENRVPVTLRQVPAVVQEAVVDAEDHNFFRHNGVDPLAIGRATWADIRGHGTRQGGSTITQQYVKNTYVGRERTLTRKLKEAVIAVKLEQKLDKHTILERYLNTIYFGRGAYGVQAAAHAYFAKDVGQLGLPEAAYLAGLIRSPLAADEARSPDLARAARSRVLQAMVRARTITAAQRAEVEQVPLTQYVAAPGAAPEATVAEAAKGTEYFVEYVRRELVRRFGEDLVLRGGLRVQTSLDLRAQAAAYDAVYGVLNRPGDPDGALVALDPDGRVVAMVGGRDWNASKVNLAVGSAGGGGGRQGGSAFKPFVLAETVREGYTVESSLPGPAKIVIPHADQGHDWEVSNFEGESFDRLNLIDATAHSVNTVYAQLVTAIGPEHVVEMAHRLGVRSPLDPVVSITLGTQNVSVLEMADSYLTFADEGLQVDPRVVLKVTTADDAVLFDNRPHRTRALESRQADVVNFVLRQVVEKGTGTGAQFGRPLAGKTGTTENYGDAWFVGYTPRLTTAVWMGYPQGQSKPMLDVHGRKVNGGSFPATVFERFMSEVTRGVDTGDFTKPSSFPGRLVPLPSVGRQQFTASTSTSVPAASSSTTAPAHPTTTVPGPTATTVAPTTTAPAPTTTRPPPPTTHPPPSTTARPKPP